MSRWLRLYVDVPDNAKVQLLPDSTFKFWINLLCLADEDDGSVPETKCLAWRLRLTESQAEEMLCELVSSGLLDKSKDGLIVHDWEERQYKHDSSTPRVRLYRERVSKAGRSINGYLKHRDEIMERDGGKCVYCGSEKNLCVDHVVPVILGGDDHIDNLAIACKSCNSGKAGRTPEQAGMTFTVASGYVAVHQRNTQRLHDPTLQPLQSKKATVSPSVSDSVSEEATKTEKASTRANDPPGYAFDEQYELLREHYAMWAPHIVEADFKGESWHEWGLLDPHQRMKAILGIQGRRNRGDDPAFAPSPAKYLRGRESEWNRPPRPAPKPKRAGVNIMEGI